MLCYVLLFVYFVYFSDYGSEGSRFEPWRGHSKQRTPKSCLTVKKSGGFFVIFKNNGTVNLFLSY